MKPPCPRQSNSIIRLREIRKRHSLNLIQAFQSALNDLPHGSFVQAAPHVAPSIYATPLSVIDPPPLPFRIRDLRRSLNDVRWRKGMSNPRRTLERQRLSDNFPAVYSRNHDGCPSQEAGFSPARAIIWPAPFGISTGTISSSLLWDHLHHSLTAKRYDPHLRITSNDLVSPLQRRLNVRSRIES